MAIGLEGFRADDREPLGHLLPFDWILSPTPPYWHREDAGAHARTHAHANARTCHTERNMQSLSSGVPGSLTAEVAGKR